MEFVCFQFSLFVFIVSELRDCNKFTSHASLSLGGFRFNFDRLRGNLANLRLVDVAEHDAKVEVLGDAGVGLGE